MPPTLSISRCRLIISKDKLASRMASVFEVLFSTSFKIVQDCLRIVNLVFLLQCFGPLFPLPFLPTFSDDMDALVCVGRPISGCPLRLLCNKKLCRDFGIPQTNFLDVALFLYCLLQWLRSCTEGRLGALHKPKLRACDQVATRTSHRAIWLPLRN